jgi:hypothetical protein
MAITYAVPIGPVVTLQATIVYALPGKKVTMFTNGTPTVQQSNTPDMVVNTPVVFTNGQAELAGAFVRVTGADAVVRLVSD